MSLPARNYPCVLCSNSDYIAQSAFNVIGNIASPLSRNKGNILGPSFAEYKFTLSPPVAQQLPTRDIRNVLPSLLQTSPIELIFGWGWDKRANFI